jgi:hypothetical protein
VGFQVTQLKLVRLLFRHLIGLLRYFQGEKMFIKMNYIKNINNIYNIRLIPGAPDGFLSLMDFFPSSEIPLFKREPNRISG